MHMFILLSCNLLSYNLIISLTFSLLQNETKLKHYCKQAVLIQSFPADTVAVIPSKNGTSCTIVITGTNSGQQQRVCNCFTLSINKL